MPDLYGSTTYPTGSTAQRSPNSLRRACRAGSTALQTISAPVVSTSFGRYLEDSGYVTPGMCVIGAYANFANTFEDCVIMSRQCRDMGMFGRVVETTVPIDATEKLKPGMIVTGKTHLWWKAERRGKITDITYSSAGKYSNVTVEY